MSMKERMKKLFSILLCLLMLVQSVLVTVFAAAEDGLCEHHTEHTAECGYAEAVEGQPCTHVHDELCGYIEAVEGVSCACVAAEDGTLTHAENCGYVEAVAGVPCTHAHDELCGYAAAVEAHECHYECAECAAVAASEEPSEESSNPAPVCTCAEACTTENFNEYCAVCGVDYSKCTGTDTAAAYAEGDKVSVTIGGETTYYTSIKDAVAKANESGNATITLLQDTTTGERLDITNSATLDLNGNTLSCTAYFADDYETMVAVTTNGAKLTIIDSVGGGKLDGTGTDYALMLGEPGAYTARSASAYIDGSTVSGSVKTVSGTSMTVSGGTVESNSVVATIDMTNETTLNVFNSQILNTHSSSTAPAIDNSGTLTITDSTVSGSIGVDNRGTANISGNTNINGTVCSVQSRVESQDSTLTITGGSYTGGIDISGGTATISGGGYTGGIVVTGGTATISDGTITESKAENAVEVSDSAELTISGGTFSATAGKTYDTGVYVHDGGTVKITGGIITSRAYGVYNQRGSATITGGSISGGTADLYVNRSDSILNLTLDEGKTVGAAFPDGITVEGSTLAELLSADTAAYWGVVEGRDTMLDVADDATSIDNDNITIRAICDHKDVKLDYITTETTHTPVCSVCNWTGEATEHTGGTATCQDPAICEACGVSYGDLDANIHTPTEGTIFTINENGTHSYTCACGAAVAEVPHTLDVTTGKCGACGADMTAIATVTDGTNTCYAADAATLNQAVTAILETGSRTFTVELPADTEAGMITAIRRAICDTEGVADGSIHLTLKGVTSIPGTTNWDGVAFGPGDIYDEAGKIVDQELVTQLASINLPDVTEIGAQAFYFCENLVSVSAPKAQTIGAQALGYTALTSVEFPELTTIPTDMFSGTWTLSSAKFPKVTTIEQGGLLVGAKFMPENNPTPFPLELTAEGDITFNGSNHFNIASQNYSGKVDLVLCCNKADEVTKNEDGTATWQVREDLSYTFKSITFKHSYVDGKCTACGEDCAHTGGTATCTTLAVCDICKTAYGELGGHTYNTAGSCTVCGAACPHSSFDSATGNCTDCETSLAIAKIKTGETTIYYQTADDLRTAVLESGDDQTITLLADFEMNNDLYFNADRTENTLDLNEYTLTGSSRIEVEYGELTITGTGSINIFMTADNKGAKIVVGSGVTLNNSLRSVDGGVLDLTNATIPEAGLNVILYSDDSDPTTYNVSDVLLLPADYYFFVGGKAAYTYSGETEGTMLKHTDHSYTYTDNGDGTHKATCTVCGYEETSRPHTIENHVCTACGAMEIVVSFDAGDFEWKTGDKLYFCRVSGNNEWEEYAFTATVAGDGTVTWTPDRTLYWDGTGEHKLVVIYPDTGYVWDTWYIDEDQSTSEKLRENDLMNAIWLGNPTTDPITFNLKHRLAKVTVNYEIKEDVAATVSNAEIYSLTQYLLFDIDTLERRNIAWEEGDDLWINSYLNGNQFTAFVSPDAYAAGGNFIKITLSDGSVREVKMNKAVTFAEGAEYTYKVVITADGAYLTCADECTFEYTDNEDGLTHSKTCSKCGYVAASEAHSGGTATCTEQAECQHCGASYGDFADHSMGYVANEEANTITYRCGTCDTQNLIFTLVIPTGAVYDDSPLAVPHYTSNDTSYMGVLPKITVGGEDYKTFTPNAGEYEVVMKWGGKTVSGEYTIAKAMPTFAAPVGLTATYGDTLASVILNTAPGETAGTWAWNDALTTSVGNAGENTFKATFTPNDTANYNTAEADITIAVAKAAPAVTAPAAMEGLTYNAQAQTLVTAGATTGGTMMYKVGDGEWSDRLPMATNAGAYTVSYKVVGGANYNDVAEKSVTVNIAPMNLAGATVTLSETSFVYDGQSHYPAVTVTLDGFGKLVEGKDYRVFYSGVRTMQNGKPIKWFGDHTTSAPCINAGDDYYAVVIGLGNFYTADAFTLYENFAITPKALTDLTFDGLEAWYLHTGEAINPAFTLKDGETALTENTDYTVAIKDNTDVGTATITVTLQGNYSGEVTKTFQIVVHVHEWKFSADGGAITATCESNIGECSVPNKTVTIRLKAPDGLTYDGEAKSVTVTQSPAGIFTDVPAVTYKGNCTDAGEHTASLTYKGVTATLPFTIAQKPLSVNSAAVADKIYDGSTAATVTDVTFTGMQSSDVLVMGTDFTATAAFADVNAGADKAVTVTVTLRNTAVAKNYRLASATANATATVNPKAITAADVKLNGSLTYNGKEQTQQVAVTEGINYTVTGNKATNVGAYELTVKGIGNYTGEVKLGWSIKEAVAVVGTAPTAKTLTYTGEEHALVNAGATAGGKLVYSLTENGEYTETIPTGKNAGSYTVWYYVVGDDNHSDSPKASVNVTIAKAKPVITVDTATIHVTYGETLVLPTATANFGTVACDKTAADMVNAGTYTVTYTVAGTANYEGATKTLTVVIGQKAVAEPTVSGAYTYTGSEQMVTLTGVESSMTVVSGNKGINAGNYEVEVILDSNHKWAEGSDGKLQWSIAKAKAEISVATDPITVTYGETLVLPTATANFGTVVCDKTAADMVNAGTYTVTYTVAGTANYDGDTKTVNVTVSPKAITAADVKLNGSLTYNGSEQTQQVTVTEGITYEVSGNQATNAGNYELTVKGTGNYTGTVTLVWTVAKLNLTITADDKVIYIGEKIPALTYKVTGFVGSDQLVKEPVLTTNADADQVGSYTIAAANADAGDNYTITYVGGSLTIMDKETEVETKIEQTELTQVPDGLKDTRFDTVEEITEELISKILTISTGFSRENMEHYDVALHFSLDGGENWILATEENFPTEGITVVLPYPQGTNPREYDFVVSHMFTVTSQRLGTTAGDVEIPQVEETVNGIRVTLNGLSPVTVAAKYHDHTGGTATCTEKAVCTICGNAYGEVDKTNHAGGTEVKDAKEATCGAEGYTGDTYCKDCNEVVEKGTAIKATGEHTYGDWKVVKEPTKTAKGEKQRACDLCDHVDSEEIPVLSDTPVTGDDSNIILYGSIFGMSLAAIIVLLLAFRKRKQENA